MSSDNELIDFRLPSEGSDKHPSWGVAFRRRRDVPRLLDTEPGKRPKVIEIEFPDGASYEFGIRDSFWTGCHEFVDAQVQGQSPVKSWAVESGGYTVKTKGNCQIKGLVVERNRRLSLVVFQ